jgi:hypothetical protein
MSGDEFLTTAQLAELLQTRPETLRYWRANSRGPRWIKPPGIRAVLYRRSDVESWLATGEREAVEV